MRRVLLVRFGSIGDLVLVCSLMHSLKKANKEIELTLLTKECHATLMRSQSSADHVLGISRSTPLFSLLKQLRKERFDAILDLHVNLRSSLVRLFLGGKKFLLQKRSWERKRMILTKRIPSHSERVLERYHHVAAQAGLLPPSSANHPIPFLEIPKSLQKETFKKFKVNEKRPYIIIAPEANWETKRWPFYNDLLVVLQKRSKKKILLIGKEAPGFPLPPGIIDLSGKTELMETAALISKADGLVCNDTGIMHMADAAKIKTVTIWGPTVKGFGFAPVHAQLEILEIPDLRCRPCSLHGSERCPQEHFKCMRLISVEDVVKKLEDKKIL